MLADLVQNTANIGIFARRLTAGKTTTTERTFIKSYWYDPQRSVKCTEGESTTDFMEQKLSAVLTSSLLL